MEKILEPAVAQAPQLVVLVVLVVLFLKESRAARAQGDAQEAACRAQLTANTEAVAVIAKDCAAAIRDNATAYGQVISTLAGTRQAIADGVRDGIDKAKG